MNLFNKLYNSIFNVPTKKKILYVDPKINTFVVYCYMRNIQRTLDIFIPDAIVSVIAKLYPDLTDDWNSEHSNWVQIKGKSFSFQNFSGMRHPSGPWPQIYGTRIVKPNEIYSWKLLLENMNKDGGEFCIYAKSISNPSFFYGVKIMNKIYASCGFDQERALSDKASVLIPFKNNFIDRNKDITIDFTLDLQKYTISVQKQSDEAHTIIRNIREDNSYRLYISGGTWWSTSTKFTFIEG